MTNTNRRKRLYEEQKPKKIQNINESYVISCSVNRKFNSKRLQFSHDYVLKRVKLKIGKLKKMSPHNFENYIKIKIIYINMYNTDIEFIKYYLFVFKCW